MTTPAALRALLDEGVRGGVWGQASLAVVRSGELVACEGTQAPEAVYDVASVTKVCTAALALGRLHDRPPSEEWPWSMGDLLAHRTGLPAWRPIFAVAAQVLRVDLPALIADEALQARARMIARAFVGSFRGVLPSGGPVYSDLNFLVLGFMLGAEALPRLARDLLFSPLGLSSMRWGGWHPGAVPTGTQRPRPGNPSTPRHAGGSLDLEPAAIESTIALDSSDGRRLVTALGRIERGDVQLEVPSPARSLDQAVDDDNAAALGGLTGHAGLWSSAPDLARLGDALRQSAEGMASGPLPPARAALLFQRACGSRTWGLDTPSGELPAIGSLLGRGPRGAAGHLGFTGCSLWIDRDAELSIALLSNAVVIERPNPRLRAFRSRVHDAVARAFAPPS